MLFLGLHFIVIPLDLIEKNNGLRVFANFSNIEEEISWFKDKRTVNYKGENKFFSHKNDMIIIMKVVLKKKMKVTVHTSDSIRSILLFEACKK